MKEDILEVMVASLNRCEGLLADVKGYGGSRTDLLAYMTELARQIGALANEKAPKIVPLMHEGEKIYMPKATKGESA